MLYQSFKYYFVRLGVSFFLLLTGGFAVLFFIHEIALSGLVFDDRPIKWGVILVSLFFGCLVFGMFGEHRFFKALDGLKLIDLQLPMQQVVPRFESLLRFTESSYFLPRHGRRLKEKVIRQYAQYLLSIGAEDRYALNIYLKAFLQDSTETAYRDMIVSVLTQKRDLEPAEIDLLLLILTTEKFADQEILDFLVSIFLNQQIFTNKSEPVLLQALEKNSPQSAEIIEFLLPILVGKERKDPYSAHFYLNALDRARPEHRKEIEDLIAACYCEGRFRVVDPVLHGRCEAVFNRLAPDRQTQLMTAANDRKVSEKWKQVRLLRSEDVRRVQRRNRESGVEPALGSRLWAGMGRLWTAFREATRAMVFKLFDGLNWLGGLPLKYKLSALGVVMVGIVAGTLSLQKAMVAPPKGPPPETNNPVAMPMPPGAQKGAVKMHTIQIAAVNRKANAEEIVERLRRHKVQGVYVVETKRKTNGYWYKVRIGKFGSLDEAQKSAQKLVEQNIINNYFLVSVGGGK
ncbi:SPOR domain-containing protein [Nitrospina watsonii]|uniref:SPOR domain-containing protein n=1 Tax=Nitrospina watsonii TaxID=1323948 RepID=A0ABM9HDA0_9BACT|nr:SPOR domain-containing protein [Nitrospina watsonii]CAI2718091.1 SPOR domain-containing protein [Nitrospina watsonii]